LKFNVRNNRSLSTCTYSRKKDLGDYRLVFGTKRRPKLILRQANLEDKTISIYLNSRAAAAAAAAVVVLGLSTVPPDGHPRPDRIDEGRIDLARRDAARGGGVRGSVAAVVESARVRQDRAPRIYDEGVPVAFPLGVVTAALRARDDVALRFDRASCLLLLEPRTRERNEKSEQKTK